MGVSIFGLTANSVRAHMFPQLSDFSVNSSPTLVIVGLLVLFALCCGCCVGFAWFRHRVPRPLPVLHVTLSGGRVVLLPLRWGAAVKRGLGGRGEEAEEHELVVVIPAGAPCREPLGLRAAANLGDAPDTVLPVSIVSGGGGGEKGFPIGAGGGGVTGVAEVSGKGEALPARGGGEAAFLSGGEAERGDGHL
jgi:hypothetical protein